jgi:hypothetical protein
VYAYTGGYAPALVIRISIDRVRLDKNSLRQVGNEERGAPNHTPRS